MQLALIPHPHRKHIQTPNHKTPRAHNHAKCQQHRERFHTDHIGFQTRCLKPTRITRVISTLTKLILAAALLLGANPAAAQTSAQTAPSEIELSLELFGPGGIARPGDWTAIRMALKDRGAAVRSVRLRLELTDADGDRALWQREATLNPGQPQGVWLFARLPFSLQPSDALRTSVVDTDGRELVSAIISPQTVIDPASPLIGLIGRSAAGLDRYRIPSEPGATTHATGHEWIEFALIDPDQLASSMPDAWMGLAPMKTIVWTAGDPATLRAPAATALAEWVRRGGHLVVSIPADSGGWQSPTGPLAAVLPAVDLVRREGIDLTTYRPLLTPNTSSPLPTSAILHELRAHTTSDESNAITILIGPKKEPIVVRRLTGAGAVTMIGIDVAQRDVAAWLDPQRFWHRVLGERFDVLSSAEMQAIATSNSQANFRIRSRTWIDDSAAVLINRTGRAGVGVLLGFIVFSVYWLLAGPAGFAILRWRKLVKHSWLFFVGVTAVFTAIAWGGASALRPARVEIAHLTFIDHVFGQNVIRTRSWFGAFLPSYGTSTIAVQDAPGLRQALTPWDPPGSTRDSFPDPRAYTIDSRRPESIDFPSRATVKQARLDWLGPSPWRSIAPDEKIELSDAGQISGTLTHGLPAALQNVTVMLVLRQQMFMRLPSGALQARTLAWRLQRDWEPGQQLDLADLSNAASRATRGDAYLDTFEQSARRWSRNLQPDDTRTALDKLNILTWGPMIGPPAYLQGSTTTGAPAQVNRRFGHGLDLARWFTQPCLIITGNLQSELPAPLTIDGITPPSSGHSVLRWVYPLPANPPRAIEAAP